MLIREIVLENFMSYKYARIPLNSGLNIVCGPNGAGKSSILLAISVALGQAYTERSKKLSDLIRWGEDAGRVTLVFDNKPKSEARPIPKFDADYFRISRYLARDGNYWFEVNFQTVDKSEVTEILREFGINPDNMLIIMHQHMMMEFGVTTPQKKLLMVEEAVGLRDYRRHVLEAKEKLTQVLSEEEAISNLLKNAEQTLAYWKSEYDKYQRRKELLLKRSFLERELLWAQLIRQERNVQALGARILETEEEMAKEEKEMKESEAAITELNENLNKLHYEENMLYNSLLTLEKEKSGVEEAVSNLSKTLDNMKGYENIVLTNAEGQSLSITAGKEDDLLKVSPEDKLFELSLENAETGFGKDSGSNQAFDKRLDELRTQAQLLKQEADKLEEEKIFLEKLTKDKEVREKTLQQEIKRLDRASALIGQINPKLEALYKIREQIVWEETRRSSLVRELNNLARRLPPVIKIKAMDDPVKLAEEISHGLQFEVDARKNVRENIESVETVVQSLTSEQQRIVTTIQILQNEVEKSTKHQSEIRLYLEGRREKPQIRCDKCGSILAFEQWVNHLEKSEEQTKEAGKRLSNLKHELEGIQERLLEKRRVLDNLRQEERILEAIQPASTQASQLLDDMKKSCESFKKNLDEEEQVIKNIARIVELDEVHSKLDHLAEQKAKEIQAEAHSLKLETPRLEKELSNFEDLYINTQRERVERARRASESYRKLLPKMMEEFGLCVAEIKSQLFFANEKRLELERKISSVKDELDRVEERFNSLTNRYQDARARNVLLEFQKEKAKQEIGELRDELDKALSELAQLQPLSEKMGPRIETDRNPLEVSADAKVIDAHLALYKDVSEDVENMYTSYLSVFNELKEKVMVVSENRESALKEVKERKKVWENLLQSLLDEVNPTFKVFLERIGAIGYVKLVDAQDIESAGLELVIGFGGANPHVLDSRTQSGGERSSATMAFLLALQRHIKSPFRAVDEFDVHMDPRNRETISQMLLMEMGKETESQYLTITPGQLTDVRENIHVITVQKVEDTSEIKVMIPSAQAV